jgi:hypothetical protein
LASERPYCRGGIAGLLGCEKSQSALDPAGRAAEQIARLFWKMAIGTVLVWLAMVGLTLYAMRGEPLQHGPAAPRPGRHPWAGDTIAKRLKPQQMRDVALYFQSLRPRRTVQTQDD